MRYRTVFISDLHLGARGCEAAALDHFLKHVRCERLYLVGDVIDMWRLKQKWYWPASHNHVLRRVLDHQRHGTEVVFVPGNHDEAARQFLHTDFGGIRVLPYAVHVTADGRRLLVVHGDQFDLVVKHSRFVSMLGSRAYEALMRLNGPFNRIRQGLGLPHRSLSRAIKSKVKGACTFISRFEDALMTEARRRGLDGVVCGHIHKAAADDDRGGLAYYNCGDWVESRSAVVEHADGRIELIRPPAPEDDPHPDDDDTVLAEEPAFADLIRSDRGLDRADQWRVTFGGPPDDAAAPGPRPPRVSATASPVPFPASPVPAADSTPPPAPASAADHVPR